MRLLALLLALALPAAHATDSFNILDGNPLSASIVRVGDGTSAAPSIAFTSQTGMGLYRVSSDVLGYRGTSNTPAFKIEGTDRSVFLGAQTADFQSILMVNSTSAGTGSGGVWFGARALLGSDTTHVLDQRNGTNAQTFRVYNTFTDASNYERAFSRWATNVYEIGDEAAGTGTARAMKIRSGSGVLTISPTGTGANQLAAIQTTVPTVTTNGGTGPVCVGSDTAMVCTIGTAPPAAATFTVTFNGTWAAAPSCIAMRGTTGTTPLVAGVVAGTGTVVVNLSANLVASEKYNIQCMGVQ